VLSNSGLTYGYLESGNLIAALRAVTTRNKSNIMSTPTIVALDNEEASLLVGQSVPFITGSATSSGATTTNPFQTIQRQDIGITLNVTPRINQGDSITLEIEQKTENVSQTANSRAADLITEKTEIKTSALIKDGQVLVLGGLIREDDVNTRTQVPILGDLPLLGRLFRSNSVSKRKNNLMVFIRPVILKDQLQISGLTAQRYAFMREKQMQNALSTFIKLTDNPALADFDEYQTITPQQDSASE
jgi:general secretion pathway protein D